MWRKISQFLGVAIAVIAIIAYIGVASFYANKHSEAQPVKEVVVSLDNASATRKFASADYFTAQLKKAGVSLEGKLIESVDALKLSQMIEENGFVEKADVYVTYAGNLHINVMQQTPVMRLMCGGFNSYITADGQSFRSPQGAACYTPIVTGKYRPLMPTSYEGSVEEYYDGLIEKQNEKIADVRSQILSLDQERSKCLGRRRRLKEERKKKLFESSQSHEYRLRGVEADIKKCDEQLPVIAYRKKQLEKRQQLIELRKKKLQKSYDDFANLINFVSQVDEDSFWSAEVVQFVADTTLLGEISLRLIPRSGDFTILFGTLEDGKAKLKKLQKFYEEGLARVGWNEYKTIDIRYDKQVVCTK